MCRSQIQFRMQILKSLLLGHTNRNSTLHHHPNPNYILQVTLQIL
jgi:hypothetical protein